MQLRQRLLTEDEVEYLLKMPIQSDEGARFTARLITELKKFPPKKPGRWDLLTGFSAREEILSSEEMVHALEDDECGQLLHVLAEREKSTERR
jgi:hypothetical protein